MDMSIDKLRKLCIKEPYTHGLGMIRVILPKYTLNFHSDLIPADAKYLHSHQRNFTSECLFGQVKNIFYTYKHSDKPTNYVLEEIQCIAGTENKTVLTNVEIFLDREEIQNPGDITKHYYKDIHDFECLSKHACTKVFFDEKLDIDAQVIRDVREDYVCALSEPRTPDFNWQIIETILNEI